MSIVELRGEDRPARVAIDNGRTGLSKEALKRSFLDNLLYVQGKFPALATRKDYYLALAYVVRDRMLQRWISTAAAYTKHGSRTVAYFSAEFLMGPQLGNNLVNLGIYGETQQAIAELGLDLEALMHEEEEPGLGQRRSRAACRLFSRFARLRDMLRIMHGQKCPMCACTRNSRCS